MPGTGRPANLTKRPVWGSGDAAAKVSCGSKRIAIALFPLPSRCNSESRTVATEMPKSGEWLRRESIAREELS